MIKTITTPHDDSCNLLAEIEFIFPICSDVLALSFNFRINVCYEGNISILYAG